VNLFVLVLADDYVVITGDDKLVLGATLSLKAEVFKSAGYPASGEFEFNWEDNAIPQHSFTEVTSGSSYWNVTYQTAPGAYNIQVVVRKKVW